MPTVRLTETAIAAATKRAATDGVRIEAADAACPGLRLRVTPSGTRTWVLGCRDADGAARRFKLGQFPEMGLADARGAARTLRGKVERGEDPIAKARAQRQQARDAKAGIGTLRAVLDRYGVQHGKNLRRWHEARQRIESVFSPHLDRPVVALRRTDLQFTADAWTSQASAGAAVRYLRPILKWAASRDLVDADAANVKPPTAIRRRDRVLSRPEVARLLPALRSTEGAYGPAMLFMLLTASRREETATARWQDIDFVTGIWTIRRTKNGQPHQVPLSRQALALLRSRGPGKPAELAFASSAGKPLVNWDRATKAIRLAANTAERDEVPLEHFTRHDLRRTAATLMGELGELPDIIEAALNHVSIRSTLAATYNRSRYRPQVAVALQRLADCLDGIETGGAEVVPLRRA